MTGLVSLVLPLELPASSTETVRGLLTVLELHTDGLGVVVLALLSVVAGTGHSGP